jgi:methionyl aminopeptidase
MAIKLKTPEQIEKMRRAGRIVRHVLERLSTMIVPGITTEELDAEAERLCLEEGGKCLFKGVPSHSGAGPFPGCICASLNEEVVHGIPSKRKLRGGDLVSVDFGVLLDGWCGDAAETYLCGDVSPDKRRLASVTKEALQIAISMAKPGVKWSTIARAMQQRVESEGFSVIREFVGHGIGREMHEDPKVPNFVSRELLNRDILLREGLVIAVEPMVNMGAANVEYAPDGWTVVTVDRMPSAHFEETLAITAKGVDVLTNGR